MHKLETITDAYDQPMVKWHGSTSNSGHPSSFAGHVSSAYLIDKRRSRITVRLLLTLLVLSIFCQSFHAQVR